MKKVLFFSMFWFALIAAGCSQDTGAIGGSPFPGTDTTSEHDTETESEYTPSDSETAEATDTIDTSDTDIPDSATADSDTFESDTIDSDSVDSDSADSDSADSDSTDSDSADSDSTDSDSADSDSTDSDSADSDSTDSDSADSDSTDSDSADSDSTDSDSADSDSTDSDSADSDSTDSDSADSDSTDSDSTDSDTGDSDTTPEQEAHCDGIDNDNDGDTDEGFFLEENGSVLPLGANCGMGFCEGGFVVCGFLPEEPVICSTNMMATGEMCDNFDNDCDGQTDEDFLLGEPCGQGACIGGVTVCDPFWTSTACSTEGMASPETCDGVDNDCDGDTDEDAAGSDEPCGVGACTGGTTYCADEGTLACDSNSLATEEICNGADDDCDGVDDNGIYYSEQGMLIPVGSACGIGECHGGEVVCEDGTPQCDTHDKIAPEECDGKDNDCDGEIDEDLALPCDPCVALDLPECADGEIRSCGSDIGECQTGTEHCEAGSWTGICLGEIPPADEIQDGVDNNCNGEVDEGFWQIPELCDGGGGSVIYVDGALETPGDGSSFASAFNSIQDALAVAGDCDEIWITQGTYELTMTLEVNTPVGLYGGFAGDELSREERSFDAGQTVIDGGSAVRCLNTTAATTIDGLTFTHCMAGEQLYGGAILATNTALSLSNVSFIENDVLTAVDFEKNEGGAIYSDTSSLYIQSCTFERNQTRWHGGAIGSTLSTIIIRDTDFISNQTKDRSGGLNIFARGGTIYSYKDTSLTIIDSTFEDNHAFSEGGAVFAGGSVVTIINSDFVGNESMREEGAAVQIAWGSEGTVTGCVFTSNYGTRYESSIIVNDSGCTMLLSDCIVKNNVGTGLFIDAQESSVYQGAWVTVKDTQFIDNVNGGIITFLGGDLTVKRTLFRNNTGFAGAVNLGSGGNAIIDECQFVDNSIINGGGAALDMRYATAAISNSLFKNNRGHFYGGAVHMDYYATASFLNCVFAHNFVSKEGSVMYIDDHSKAHIGHTTIVGNVTGDVEGGSTIYVDRYSELHMQNSILSVNTPDTISGRFTESPVFEVTDSIIYPYWRWDDESDNNTDSDPLFTDILSNDFHLTVGSPAVEMGAATLNDPMITPDRDLDGHVRAFDADEDGTILPDKGAFEWVNTLPNTAPLALPETAKSFEMNGLPQGHYTLDIGRTCDPEEDPLEYTWVGPFGTLIKEAPTVALPEGRSIVTMWASDDHVSSNRARIELDVTPCFEVTLSATGGSVKLDWSPPADAISYTVFRAGENAPSRLVKVGTTADSTWTDATLGAEMTYIYKVVAKTITGQCVSNSSAVHLDKTVNHSPVITSIPASYGSPSMIDIESKSFEALPGILYSYDVNAQDPEGDSIVYGLKNPPEGMTIDPATGLITFGSRQKGIFAVTVTATDIAGNTATQQFDLVVRNTKPLADAGSDRGITSLNTVVTLEGQGSTDADGDTLTYYWSLESHPFESNATLSDDSLPSPTFTADKPGQYVVSLTVSDGTDFSEPDIVIVTLYNTPPVADSSYDNAVEFTLGDIVALDGSRSFDPDGEPLNYQWSFFEKPEGSSATIDNATSVYASFQPDRLGQYFVRLVTNDGFQDGPPDFARITIINRDPIARGAEARTVMVGETVYLDASESSDPDGDPLNVYWYLVAPDGSGAKIYDPDENTNQSMSYTWVNHVESHFTPDIAGTYGITLDVYDPNSGRDIVDVDIIAVGGNTAPSISSVAPDSATEAIPYSYNPIVEDPDGGDTHLWSIIEGPDGMTIDESSGLVDWTPTAKQVGEVAVTIQVTDGSGLSDDQTFTITITEAPKTPILVCPADRTVVAGKTLGSALKAYDSNTDDVLSYALDSAPANMTIDAGTGVLGWLTTLLDVGTHSIIARVEDSTAQSDSCSFTVEVISPDDDDEDNDGFTENQGDCDDTRAGIHPDAVDVAANGVDEDCIDGDATVSVKIVSSHNSLTVPVGQSRSIRYTIYFDTADSTDYTLSYSTEAQPNTENNTIVSSFGDPKTLSSSKVIFVDDAFTGDLPGEFEAVSTVTIAETGQTAEIRVPVTVSEVDFAGRVTEPGFSPPAIAPGAETFVAFSVRLIGTTERPESIRLMEVDSAGEEIAEVGWLLDDGFGEDLQRGDQVYTGTFGVQSAEEGHLHYAAELPLSSSETWFITEVGSLPVTRFPIGTTPPDLDNRLPHKESGLEFIADRLLVTFTDQTTSDDIETALATVGGAVVGTIPELGIYQAEIPEQESAKALLSVAAALLEQPRVETADPSSIIRLASMPVEDEFFGLQTHMRGILAPDAWLMGFGDEELVVAVVDSGIDYYHPDLSGKYIRGLNNACFADIVPGCREDPYDDNGHGTSVAGLMAGKTSSRGIAGVAPNVRILAVKAFDNATFSTDAMVAEGLSYAARRGAKIINFSGAQPNRIEVFAAHNYAVRYAHRRGSLIVAAAGNERNDEPQLPAAFPQVLSVGGVEKLDDAPYHTWDEGQRGGDPSIGTNYGDWVDLSAPAKQVFAPRPTIETFDFVPDMDCFNYLLDTMPIIPEGARRTYGCYGRVDGTSFASPLVAGAAALLATRFPYWTTDQLKDRLMDTTVPLADKYLGTGMLDVFNALYNGGFEAAEPEYKNVVDAVEHFRRWPCYEWQDDPDGYFTWLISYYPCHSSTYPLPENYGWYFAGYRGVETSFFDFRDKVYGEGGAFIERLGNIIPIEGSQMAFLTTGAPGETYFEIYERPYHEGRYYDAHYLSFIEQRFELPPFTGELTVSFWYNVVTEESGALVGRDGCSNPDHLRVVLETAGEERHILLDRHLWEIEDNTGFIPAEMGTLENAVPLKQTDWQYVQQSVPIAAEEKSTSVVFRAYVADGWDRAYDSVLLLDDVRIE